MNIMCILFFSKLMEMRNTYKDEFFRKHGVKLGYMSAFVKAASFALKDQPIVNAGTLHQCILGYTVAVLLLEF